MLTRKSSKLERVQATASNEVRTRTTLSFDIGTGQKDEREGGDRSELSKDLREAASPKASSSGSSLRHSWRVFLARKETSNDPPSGGDTSQEYSPSAESRKKTGSRSDSGESSSAKLPSPQLSKTRSRLNFSPRAFSLLRISTSAANKSEEEREQSTDRPSNAGGFLLSESEDGEIERASSAQSFHGDSTKSPTSRISQRLLSGLRSSPSPSSRTTSPRLPENIDEQDYSKLETMILDPKSRDELVHCLLAQHVDGGGIKVRFIGAVLDFEKTPNKTDKIALGKKILSTFLHRDASFPIPGIPRDQLAAVSFDTLDIMRVRVMIDLLGLTSVTSFIRSYSANDQVDQERTDSES